MTITRVADRYTLDHEVGRGACGSVWAANDDVLDRPVAIKRVGPPPGSADTEAVRAEREAKLAAQVAHPHVISVFDLVQDDDHHWLVMEYVDGCPLSTIIRERGPLPPEEVAGLVAPVADALAFAHDLGIVHRDVKPSNILVRRDGEPKLTDFGIARAVEDATLTQTGAVTGSPAYVAPEIVAGGPATPASDVWSFGATLYHALVGKPPFHVDGEDNAVLAVLYRIANEDPPRLPSAGPLGRLLELTMALEPADRLTMAEVRDFLAEQAGVPAAPAQTMILPGAATADPPGAEPSVVDMATAAWTPEPTPAGAPPADQDAQVTRGGRRRTAVLAATAVAAVAAMAALGVLLLASGGPDETGTPVADSAGAVAGDDQDPSPDPAGPTDPTAGTDAAPTAEEMEAFAADYVRAAQADPAAGFRMLTKAYQRRSPSYADFWGRMSNPRMLDVSADPDAMTVTYTYKYDFPSVGNRTETVTLALVERDGRLLIAGDR